MVKMLTHIVRREVTVTSGPRPWHKLPALFVLVPVIINKVVYSYSHEHVSLFLPYCGGN